MAPERPSSDENTAANDGEDETYEPGEISVRILNLGTEPVDLYVRTTGRVRAFPVQEGLAVGEVSEHFFPPAGGSAVITRAGAGDATCMSGCDHIIGQIRASDNNGDAYTGIIGVNRDREEVSTIWENAPEERQNFANAMPVANAEQATAIVATPSRHDHRYGLRLAFGSSEGCVVPQEDNNILVGGNQTHTLLFGPGSEEVFLYALSDRECAEEPVAGPFEISGEAGERQLLILHGAPEAMESITLPLATAEATEAADEAAADDAAADDAAAEDTAAEE